MEVITFHYHHVDSFFGKLIEWRTGSGISHVSIEIRGYSYNAYLQERFYKTDYRSDDIVESYSFVVNNDVAESAIAILENAIGTLYDIKSLFGFITNTNSQSRSRFYCSEIANEVFELLVPGTVRFKKLISPEIMRIAMIYYTKGLENKSPSSFTRK